MNAAGAFCQPDDGIYLRSHSVGLLPQKVRQTATANLFETWTHRPSEAWNHWLTEIEAFRHSLSRLLGDSANNYCPQANVSSGLAKILHSLPPPSTKTTILLAESSFPTLGFVCQQATARGYQLAFIPRDQPLHQAEVWLRHMDDSTSIVVATHASSTTGQLAPIIEIAAHARNLGIVTIVDVAQSAGIVPIDVAQWKADFLLGSCVKWLCGGPGAGFLWANPLTAQRCTPIDVGWFSHQNPFDFDIHNFRYADNALRFWGGTPSIAPASIARGSLDYLTEVTPTSLRTHNLRLTTALLEQLDPASVVSPASPNERSGTVVVHPTSGTTNALADGLSERGIAVDQRKPGVRISPHIYNTLEEIDEVAAAINQLSDS